MELNQEKLTNIAVDSFKKDNDIEFDFLQLIDRRKAVKVAHRLMSEGVKYQNLGIGGEDIAFHIILENPMLVGGFSSSKEAESLKLVFQEEFNQQFGTEFGTTNQFGLMMAAGLRKQKRNLKAKTLIFVL